MSEQKPTRENVRNAEFGSHRKDLSFPIFKTTRFTFTEMKYLLITEFL